MGSELAIGFRPARCSHHMPSLEPPTPAGWHAFASWKANDRRRRLVIGGDMIRRGHAYVCLLEGATRRTVNQQPEKGVVSMADHLDSPGPIAVNVGDDTAHVRAPNGDPRTDITHVFAFL